MEKGKDSRVGAAPFQVRVDVDALEQRTQSLGRKAAGPLVEIAEDDLGAGDAAIVNEGGETRRLVAALEDCRAEMDVIDVQLLAAAQIEVGALARPRLARAPRQVVLA